MSYRPKCPVGGCNRTHKAEELMCAGHWRKVPRALQLEVGSAFRKWKRDPSAGNLGRLRELQSHAVQAASLA